MLSVSSGTLISLAEIGPHLSQEDYRLGLFELREEKPLLSAIAPPVREQG